MTDLLSIAVPSFETGGVANFENFLAAIGNQHDFSLDDIIEFVGLTVPVALTGSGTGLQPEHVDAELGQSRCVTEPLPRAGPESLDRSGRLQRHHFGSNAGAAHALETGTARHAMQGGMTEDVELGCRCDKIHGWVRGVSPSTVNRAICYCDDCQAFLHHLGRADLLDAHGGTDIVQVAPGTVTFDRGAEHIVGLRLTPKGLYRWHASCCKTPLGNTLLPTIPFIGMALEVFRGAPDVRRRDELFGKVRGAVCAKYATGGVPESSTKTYQGRGLIGHMLRLMLGWKFSGQTWPHPFFDRATRAPSHPVTALDPDEREALRAKCGPNPSVFDKPTS